MKKSIPILFLVALLTAAAAHFVVFGQRLHFVVDASIDAQGGFALVDHSADKSRLIRTDARGEVLYLREDQLQWDDVFLKRPEVVVLGDNMLVRESVVNHHTYKIESERLAIYGKDIDTTLYEHIGAQDYFERVSGLYAREDTVGFYYSGDATVDRYELPLLGGEAKIVESCEPPEHAVASQWLYTADGTALLTTQNEIFLYAQDGTFQRIYPARGKSALITQIGADTQGKLFAVDIQAGGLYAISSTGEATLMQDVGRRFSGAGTMIRDLLELKMYNPSLMAGIYSDASTVATMRGDASEILSVHRPLAWLIVGDAAVFASALALLLLIRALIVVWRKKERFVPIVVKQLAFGLPVTIAGAVLLYFLASYAIGNAMTRQFGDSLYSKGAQRAERIDGAWLGNLSLEEATEDFTYQKMTVEYLSSNPFVAEISTRQGESTVRSYDYYWLFAVRDGGVILTAACEDKQVGIPLHYVYRDTARANYEQVLSERMPVYCEIRDTSGDWILSLIPIFENGDGTGAITGILEAGTTSFAMKAAVQRQSFYIAVIGCAITVGIIAMVLVMLTHSLRPLGKLKATMQAVARGQYGLTVKVRSHDEVAQIGHIFNGMSGTIQTQLNELMRLNAAYYRFVPLKLIEMLGRSNVLDVALGDQIVMPMSVLQLQVRDFDALATTMSAQELFRFLNEIYEAFVPLLNRYGGVVDRYTEAGWISLFTGGQYDAMSAAVDIMERFANYNELRAVRGENPVDIGVAVARGPVMLGVLGHKDRMSAMAISEVVNMTQYMLAAGRRMGSHIIVADTLGDAVGQGFACRRLGRLAIGDRSERVELFDCFDGDTLQQRALKLETLEDFTAGVAFYTQGEHYKARKAFIDVLRQNPGDAAATAYLIRCDQIYRREGGDADEGGAMFVYS